MRKKFNLRSFFADITPMACVISVASSAFLAFGLYHVHSFAGVTEGGILGLVLLLDYWFHVSPAVTSFLLNAACYLIGWKLLGKNFIIYSAISTAGFSGTYALVEQMEPLWPHLYETPLLAAVFGALFVGIGAGFCVWVGGAPGGDDALAMGLSKLFHTRIEVIYLASDLTVLALSLTYIPASRLLYSLLTVLLSGQIIGWIQRIPVPACVKKKKAE